MRLRRFRLEAADFEIYVERLGHYGIWGSLAEQLGKGEQFARYISPLLTAPGPEAWKQLLGGDPLLLFLDELPPYLRFLG